MRHAIAIAAALAAAAGCAARQGSSSGSALTISTQSATIQQGGASTWLAMDLVLDVHNPSPREVVVGRLILEPDFPSFNEAFTFQFGQPCAGGFAIAAGQRVRCPVTVVLLNAALLYDRQYDLSLRLEIETPEGLWLAAFSGTYVHSQDPAIRSLTVPPRAATARRTR